MHSRNYQTATASPVEPGELPIGLGLVRNDCFHCWLEHEYHLSVSVRLVGRFPRKMLKVVA